MRNNLWGSGLASSGSRQRQLKCSCEDSNKIVNFTDPLNFLSIEEMISFWRGILLHEVANQQAVFLSVSKPYSTNVETVSSRAVIAPIVAVFIIVVVVIIRGGLRRCWAPRIGFLWPSPRWEVKSGAYEWVHKPGTYCSNQVRKMTWLGVISLVISKWSSSLRNFLTMEQVLRPLHVPGKFMRSDKSSLVSFRPGVLSMISLAD